MNDRSLPEAKAVTDTREPKTAAGGFFTLSRARPGKTRGSRLANWPPTFRAKTSRPILMKHAPGETSKVAKPRGWRMTRAVFSEFSED